MTNEPLLGRPTPPDPTVAMPSGVAPPISGAPVSGAAQPISGAAARPVSGAAAQPVSGAHPGPYPYPQAGYPQPRYPTQPGYPAQAGYPQAGPAQPGFPQGQPWPAYPPQAYAQPGYPPQGYAQPGYPPQGYAQPGYPPPGYPRPGYPAQFAAVAPDGRRLAEFSDRLLARLIDAGILIGVALVLFIPLIVAIIALVGGASQADTSGSGTGAAAFVVGIVVIELLFILAIVGVQYYYEVEWVMRHDGQTIGKRVMKIAIVPLTPGAPMVRTVYSKRWLAQLGMSFIPFMSYVDGLWQLWDKPYRQCLHDKWPQTVVVKVGA